MKNIICFAILLIFTFSFLQAQTSAPATKLPTADEIIEKYLQATGGKEANFKIKTARIFGTLEISGFNESWTFDVYGKAPNKLLQVLNLGRLGEFREGFNGQTAWIRTEQLGVQIPVTAKQAEIARNADFYKYFNFKKHFSKTKVSMAEKALDKPAYVIEATPAAGGNLEKMYFDAQTGLLIRVDLMRIGLQGKNVPTTVYYNEYKEIDGIKIPFYIQQISGKTILVQKIVGIKNNVAINDAIFEPPVK